MGNESPIFSKCYDLILWVSVHTEKFPKSERFRFAKRIEDSVFHLHSLLLRAAQTGQREAQNDSHKNEAVLLHLKEADLELKSLQFYFRLTNQKHLTNTNQYEYVSAQLVEMGKLLGGWIKKVQ